jgi:thiosulfate/3-mercaptopyruvate sulfurtransferase
MSPESRSDSTVDVDWIAAHVGDPGLRLVEIDVSRAAYDAGHIPGAVLWNAYADLRDPNYKPVGLAELARLLSRSGITPETCVVTYGYSAPLGFWLLRAHGHEDVRMLVGSREQWAQMGHEWSTQTPAVAESAHPPVVASDDLLASREAVQSAIDDPAQLVLDVRAEGEYTGELFWPSGATDDTGRTGHVPGAVSVPIGLLRAEDGTLRTADQLRRVFEQAGVTKDKALITIARSATGQARRGSRSSTSSTTRTCGSTTARGPSGVRPPTRPSKPEPGFSARHIRTPVLGRWQSKHPSRARIPREPERILRAARCSRRAEGRCRSGSGVTSRAS